MADLIDELPARDRTQLRAWAAEWGMSASQAALAIVHHYMILANNAPGALPPHPLRPLSAKRGAGA